MTPLVLPRVIQDRYELGELLGSGGSASVYRVVDRSSGAERALKFILQPLTSPASRARFDREVAAHQRLRHLSGVVTVYDHGITDDHGWLVMDRHDRTLAERITRQGPAPTEDAIRIATSVATTLAAIHEAGVIHRDLKPSNIFLDDDATVTIGDLGVVGLSDEATLTGLAPMSLRWAAPETIETGETSPSSDLYSLGATIFTLIEGHPPFDFGGDEATPSGGAIAVGPALRLITSGPRPELGPEQPAELRSLAADLLSADPKRRPVSAREVLYRLGSPGAALDSMAIPPAPSRRPLMIASGLLVVMILLAAFFGWRANSSVETTAAQCDNDALVCGSISLADYELLGDPSFAAFAEVDSPWGSGLKITPNAAASGGGYAAERSIAGLGQDGEIVARWRMYPEQLPAGESTWFQQFVTVADERRSFWSLNLVGVDQNPGTFRFNIGYSTNASSGGTTAGPEYATDEWYCVELKMNADADSGPAVEVLVDGESIAELPDADARDLGVGFMVALGPRWLEDGAHAPVITIADLLLANQSVGCES